jgi:hypothetical protein
VKALAAALLGGLLVGCSGNATSHPTLPESATVLPSATEAPSPTATPTVDVIPPDASHGPLVVYVSRLPGNLPGDVTYELVAFDTSAGKRWASFQCGLGCGEARLAPDGSIYF